MSEWREKLDAALSRRQAWISGLSSAGTDVYRLCGGAREGLPGLLIDRLGPVALLQRREGEGDLPHEAWATAAEWAVGPGGAESAYYKIATPDRSSNRPPESLSDPTPAAGTPAPEKYLAKEGGLSYWVRPYDGYATGIYPDQRSARAMLRERAKNGKVLNLFSYTCAFSVACAAEGAITTSVDISKKSLEWGKANFAANALEVDKHEFFATDARRFLEGAIKRERRFDVVIVDPPSFARGPSGIFSVRKDAAQLLNMAAQCVVPGGWLYFSSNFSEYDEEVLCRLWAAAKVPDRFRMMPLPPLGLDFSWDGRPLSRLLMERSAR